MVIGLLAAAGGSARAQLISPGELSDGHAALDGDGGCSSCHSEGKKVVAEKCLGCHGALARRVRAGQGLHGGPFRGKPCADCHVEHNGRSYRLIRWPGGKMEKLDHRQTGWPLQGDHASLSCLRCHKAKNTVARPTFLGLPGRCAGCHQDPHAGRFGAGCQTCHGESEWRVTRLTAFDHARTRYPLLGKHAAVDCAKCHREPPRWKGIEFDRCDRCHQDPHRGKFAQACSSCHSEVGWQAISSGFRRREHRGLSLANGHRRVACARCHDRGGARPPSKGRTCAGCHPPVHEAAFGRRCESCHGSIEWLGLPRAIGLAAHEKTPFALTGRHRQTDCARCHPASNPPARRYRQLAFDRCGACHQDRHAGEFAARAGGAECAGCHTTAGFAPASFGVAAHGATRFALEGRHQAVACGGCHPGRRPRLDFRIARQSCADCHQNPHGNQFAREMAAGGCASCHGPRGWGEPRIDHSSWPLSGAHARTACARCHGAVGAAGAAAYRGVPRTCEGCHEDVHAGQFRLSEPVRPCADCHATDRFALPGFDHRGETGYPLDGKHRAVACARCHRREELAGGARAVRYRLGYRKCRDCHANPHREGP
ncbi:MAG TPA: cytochrome c3 family protein [Kofleriaceae bacterium]|nr:cytochrome c3 family protein [Kofleriaceae bacterium]